jgi:predicted rRNA methylase YqxC with S4 and FtsJ domains
MEDVLSALIDEGLGIRGVTESPITGTKGNTEFFALLHQGAGLTVPALLSSLTL